MPSSLPCSRTCGTDPPIDGSGRDPRAVPRSATGRPAAGRPRRLRACAGGTARQRPGVRGAVRRVPGRARDARCGRVDRRRPDRPGRAGTSDRGTLPAAPGHRQPGAPGPVGWGRGHVDRGARRVGVDGEPVLRDARHRVRSDLHGSSGARHLAANGAGLRLGRRARRRHRGAHRRGIARGGSRGLPAELVTGAGGPGSRARFGARP